ncbi:MAG: DUF106 domain-containing protein [Candidatus Heimdallarchaeota archaeon]|nr:DUF106 domain-containing protein [Candidatus Heimdallarchaeota archaeon]
MASPLDDLRLLIEEWLWSTGTTLPPFSGIFFIFVTIFMSLFSNMLNRLLLDTKAMARQSEIMAKHNKDKKLAMETRDKKLWLKTKRQEPMIQELQMKSTMSTLLPMLITYGPIIFIFTTLRDTFQAPENLAMNATCQDPAASCGGVVLLPFKMPDSWTWFSTYTGNPNLSIAGYGFWYFLTAIVTSTFSSKVLGINLSRNPQGGRGI